MKLFALGAALTGCASPGPTGGGSAAPPFTAGVSTLAGTGQAGYVDGDRDVARFANPVNVAYGPDGNLYVADFDNNKLRVVAADGTTETLIEQATFMRPFGLAFGPDGTLWVSTDNDQTGAGHDARSGSIWRVDTRNQTATVVANAIGRPRSLCVLRDGRLAASDDLHDVIETIDPATGAVTVLAGTLDAPGFSDGIGAAARFARPYGIVQRPDGNLVVADFDNQRLRLVGLDGTVTTLAGTGAAGYADGALATAQFHSPQGLAITGAGELYVTDPGNYRVRRVTATAVDTFAGNGIGGYVDADDNLSAELYGLEGLSVTPDGSMVYVADGTRGEVAGYNRVRMVSAQ
jgi:DNA-binding beta-propeller fold protein YncE